MNEAPAPAVIALNNLAAGEAVNHFMLSATGLHHNNTDLSWTMHHPRSRERLPWAPRQDPACPWCTNTGLLGAGTNRDHATSHARL